MPRCHPQSFAWRTPLQTRREKEKGAGAESEVAHNWARCPHNPSRPGGLHRFRAGGRITSGPQLGKGGYITPAAWGVPTALERGAESEVAHKCPSWLHNPAAWGSPLLQSKRSGQRWLHNPCRLGGPHRFEAGGRMRTGPQLGKLATKCLTPWGSPPL